MDLTVNRWQIIAHHGRRRPRDPYVSLILDGLPTFAHYFSTKEMLNYLPRKVKTLKTPLKPKALVLKSRGWSVIYQLAQIILHS